MKCVGRAICAAIALWLGLFIITALRIVHNYFSATSFDYEETLGYDWESAKYRPTTIKEWTIILAPIEWKGPPKVYNCTYVFFASDADYLCYALVAIRQLYTLSNEHQPLCDVVVMVLRVNSKEATVLEMNSFILDVESLETAFPSLKQLNVRIAIVRPFSHLYDPVMYDSFYYLNCYGKLRAFQLYNDYKRIIYMDADGLLLQPIEHLFTTLNFSSTLQIAVAPATHADKVPQPWIGSSFFVAQLSEALWLNVSTLLTIKSMAHIRPVIQELYNDSTQGIYDMELLNYLTDRGRRAIVLDESYSIIDTVLNGDFGGEISQRLSKPFYVHFSKCKPHIYKFETKYELDESTSAKAFVALMHRYWRLHDVVCPNS